MNMARIALVLLILLGTVLVCPDLRADSSLTCDVTIVSVNETRRDVEEACGPPAFIDTRQEEVTLKIYRKAHQERVDRQGPGDRDAQEDAQRKDRPRTGERGPGHHQRLVDERTFLVNYEEWTYNFGSSRLIRTLVFKDDRLVSITAGGYGFDEVAGPDSIVEKGASKPVVMMKYGKPADVSKHHELKFRVDSREEGDLVYVEERRRPVDKEEWTYDLGPDRFMKKLFFVDNRLVKVRSLGKKGKKK